MRIFGRHRRSARQNLLPRDAYPSHLTPADRRTADAVMQDLMPLVPTKAGVYLDGEGDRWTLHPDGSWTDRHGTTRGPEWSPLIALFGPWGRAEVDKP